MTDLSQMTWSVRSSRTLSQQHRESESEEYLRTLSGVSISFDNTFRAATKATVTSREKKKLRVLKGGIISLMNENGEIVGWSNTEISELLQGLKTHCDALDVPPPEIFVADNCCHVRSTVTIVFPGATMKLDVWHFIMRYPTVILNPSKNPYQKEVVAEVSACILKKHAEGGSPAKNGHAKVRYGQWGHARFTKSSLSMCIKGASSIHSKTSGQMEVMWRAPTKRSAMTSSSAATFVSPSQGQQSQTSSHPPTAHTMYTFACCLPELQDVPSNEHFGLIELSFASTFGGLLDVKAKDSPVNLKMSRNKLLEALSDDGDTVDLILQSTRAEILEEFDINPQLLSMPLSQAGPLLAHPHATPVSSIKTDAQPQAVRKRKADDDTIVISNSETNELLPRKIMRHLTATPTEASQGIPPATLDHFLKPRSRLPYSKALSRPLMATSVGTPSQPQHEDTANIFTPILRPPGMTWSQHFFTIVTRIDACAMQISGDVEFHLFMDLRAECTWISFKMTPRQWAVATETYNCCLKEKNRAIGLKTVKKNRQNDFKSCSGSETFWRRHCHVIELIKAKPGKKLHKAHMCSRCQTIMYPSPENLGYNHRHGFCADSTKQVSKNEPPPPWPQPLGIFSEGKHFHPRAFLETVKQIYKQVFLRPSGESPALEQEAFTMMLLDRSMTLEEGMVLFKLYEELEIDKSTPDALLTVHNSIKHLCVEYLQEHWDS
ncbi:uncharacterized protein F5891DRAFT_1187473 [Suillus fuscotomentosus]|uniref:Uncharacterized protein n=1 Tax=Suillus fuscotomentosus TaxID=1912939 RepID=A0AAD4HM78_9AGAM|nr:uncharacterized protein F5891DRAFT_1187473 [Suillus fuscotomentosus]KAG1901602.1 hypothetical protein F5891DRAFT_1187473 [Suillus fuscotomentosus]